MRQPLQGRVGRQYVQAVWAVLVIDLQDAQVPQRGQSEQGVEVILVSPQVQLLQARELADDVNDQASVHVAVVGPVVLALVLAQSEHPDVPQGRCPPDQGN